MSAAFVAILLLLCASRYGWFPLASDDSYIYLGYVKILLQSGDFFSYNPGEHSAGTTGALYYYLLSVAGFLVYPLLRLGEIGKGLSFTAWIVNSLLFVGMSAILVRIWRCINPSQLSSGIAWEVFLLGLTVLNPIFIWGWFAGLENPLSGVLSLLLLERALGAGAPLQIGALGAALAGCRPELAPIAFIAVILASFSSSTADSLWRNMSLSLLSFFGALLLIVLPCWLSTGTPFPSALGTRVTIPPLLEGKALMQAVLRLAANKEYLLSGWVVGSGILLIGTLVIANDRPARVLAAVAGLLVVNFAMRGLVGLTGFDAHDRYVSYLWPIYALLIVHLVSRGAGLISRSLGIAGELGPVFTKPLLWLGVASWLAAPFTAFGYLRNDADEMNQVVVDPALWMAGHIPSNSRVAMEPAGAIRLFTPFYLVDAVGLTTQHLSRYVATLFRPIPLGEALRHDSAHYEEFLRRNGVTHVFDYPSSVPSLQEQECFRRLATWQPQPRRFSGGLIALYQVLDCQHG